MDAPYHHVLNGSRAGSTEVATLEVLRTPEGVVALRGELELTTVDDALWYVERWAPADGIVLDLDGVTFVDLKALRALLALAGRTSRDGGSLVLRRPSPPVQRLIQLSQTAGSFDSDDGSVPADGA
jgi:anti-sigma B factor antagonist